MIEKCSPRRMVTLGVGILLLTTVIFVLEEYVEESEADAYVMKGRTDWGSTLPERSKNEVQPQKGVQLNRDLVDAECYLLEAVAPLELCVECSSFERNAIKAAHCAPTGFYDKLNCTSSGKLGLRPCFTKGAYAKMRFNVFFGLMALFAGASYAAVSWRQGLRRPSFYLLIAVIYPYRNLRFFNQLLLPLTIRSVERSAMASACERLIFEDAATTLDFFLAAFGVTFLGLSIIFGFVFNIMWHFNAEEARESIEEECNLKEAEIVEIRKQRVIPLEKKK
ncbi:hypothetical protein QR680_016761 [Steinernema hermaphroditum]|uniref:Uncharacterized protein n=1 Tax=Steinernema hermaphroditum TaxID=289476 RepID=A0AA39LN36_9BILA|nr:hypothetical protein QR680_016761 [Steinernema hermaphroditum]